MSRGPITHLSEQGADYCEAIGNAKSQRELHRVLKDYASLFPDALEAMPRDADEFKAWRVGLLKERNHGEGGREFMDRFGAVLLPDVLVAVTMVAARFDVPWGCAYRRMLKGGCIKLRDGVSHVASRELLKDAQ
jgi:hypothetical protein